MKIEHIALWAANLEVMRTFYEEYFGATSNDRYINERKGFSSYFLTFENGARLELMHRPDIVAHQGNRGATYGLAHMAISVGSKEAVNTLTEKMRNAGHTIKGEPRITGDGYYESVVLDPEGNYIEITI